MENEKKLPLYGMTFVITGTTDIPREELANRIRELGGKVTLGISKSTSYVLQGRDPGPAKERRALELGVKIINEHDFVEMTKDFVVPPQKVVKNKESVESEKWIDKHKPECVKDMVGNNQQIAEVKQYMVALNRKPLLITGPSGVGKTLAVYLVAKELGVTVIEYNSSHCRNKAEISNLSVFSTQKTLFSNVKENPTITRNKILFLEEIEEMRGSDRGGLSEMLSLFKETKIPIIMTVNDKSSQSIKAILPQCKIVTFFKLDARMILSEFKKIIKKEEITIPDNTLHQIAIACAGDLRYGINTLQCLSKKDTISTEDIKTIGKEITTYNTFDITRDIFSPSNPIQKKLAAYSQDYSLALYMVFENYLEGTVENVAQISECLSYAENLTTDMVYNGKWNLFPLASYYTVVKPKLKLSKVISFTKYLGFTSAKESKHKKLVKLKQYLNTAQIFDSWNVLYRLYVLAAIFTNKNIPIPEKNKLLQELSITKDNLQFISEITDIKISIVKIKFPALNDI